MLMNQHGWKLRSGRKSWIWNHPSFSCIRFWRGYGLKQLWRQKVFSGGTSEALRLPEWEQDWRPKVWGESVSLMPLGEEVEDRKYRAESQAASQKAWASCLSQPGTSGHVSTSCPQKTNQALCRALVCLRADGIWPRSINRLLTSRRSNSFCVGILQAHSTSRVQSGFNSFILCILTEQQKWDARQYCG